MLAIRLQRTGRSGHSQFRVIVQDSRFSPTRGRVVAYLGSYNPHTKTSEIDSEKASQYLSSGAQPSDRVARLMKQKGIKLPEWVKLDSPKEKTTRNPDKRRSTRPPDDSPADSTGQATEPKAPEVETHAEPVTEAVATEPKDQSEKTVQPDAPESQNQDEVTTNDSSKIEDTPEKPAQDPAS